MKLWGTFLASQITWKPKVFDKIWLIVFAIFVGEFHNCRIRQSTNQEITLLQIVETIATKCDLLRLLYQKTFLYMNMKQLNKFNRILWSQKYLPTKSHVHYFEKICAPQNYLKLFKLLFACTKTFREIKDSWPDLFWVKCVNDLNVGNGEPSLLP